MVICEIDSKGIARLSLNRPEIHNAFNDEVITLLTGHLEDLSNNDQVRVVILTGIGKSFSAGGDLNYMRSMINYDMETNKKDAEKLAGLMYCLNSLNKATIARVNGAAYAGGVGLVSCCDIAVGTEKVVFALTETKLGLAPATISPYVINAIGPRHARRYFLTGELINAQKALQIGLLHEVVPEEELDQKVDKIANILLKNGPNAINANKLVINGVAFTKESAERRDYTASEIAKLRVSPEGQEGISSFLEKRPASWNKK